MKNNTEKINFLPTLFLIFILFITCMIIIIYNVKAETIIYDNITTSNYKFIIIEDTLNLKNINEYDYNILYNDSYYGTFSKGDKIFYPNNTNVIIQFNPPIKTNPNELWTSIAKPTIITFLGFAFTYGLLIMIVLYVVYRMWKKRG